MSLIASPAASGLPEHEWGVHSWVGFGTFILHTTFRRSLHLTEARNVLFTLFHQQSDFAQEESRFGYYSAFTLRNVCTDETTSSATPQHGH